MSANNQLVIYKDKEKNFIVGHLDVDCGWIQLVMFSCKTLKEAIEKANNYMSENEVEYGLQISQNVYKNAITKKRKT